MSDYVEDAAREIKRSIRIDGIPMKDWMAASEAAIAAATPHIRAALFKELAAKIDDDPSCLFGVLHGGDCFDGAVVNWIAAQYRKENQP